MSKRKSFTDASFEKRKRDAEARKNLEARDFWNKARAQKICEHDFGYGYPICRKCDYDPIKGVPLTPRDLENQRLCQHDYVTYHYEVGGGGMDSGKAKKLTRCTICYKKRTWFDVLLSKFGLNT